MTETHRPIAEIEAELKAARKAEDAARAEKAKEIVPKYIFTITPSETNNSYQRVYDKSCLVYTIAGEVTNPEELRAIGRTPFQGSMRYVFNTLSGMFVMSVGGGSSFVSDPGAFEELSEYVLRHPNGGDVTDIISAYRGNRG